MRSEDVRAYLSRDWAALAELKEQAWLEQRRRRGIPGALEIADELRRQVRGLRPAWPSDEERAEDLAVHVRVAEWLRRVRTRRD
jgi:hypothetical protein